MASPKNSDGGVTALQRLKSIDPPLFLSPSPSLSEAARSASEYLFSTLHPFCPKAPFDTLLVEGFDAEQIWQQIDLQTKPLLSNLRREVKRFEKNPEEISEIFGEEMVRKDASKKKEEIVEEEDEGFEDLDDLDDDEEIGGTDEDDEEDEDEEEEEEDEDEEEDGGGGGGGIEDKFLKIKELEEYMEDDEAREYGFPKEKRKQKQKGPVDEDESEEDEFEDGDEGNDDDDDDDEEEDDEIGGFDAYGDEDDDKLGTARYEDFFGGKKRAAPKRKSGFLDGSEDADRDDEQDDDEQDDDDGQDDDNDHDKIVPDQNGETLSTHEKQLKKLQSEIKKIEKTNLEPKTWTMQGEVTAAKRPKNSALEVDLDFEHNVRPAPVITEEVTASLEDIIKKRILEAHFDDVRKAPSMPSKAPRETKELDENKNTEGLAKIYEKEFEQKTGLASAPLTFSDELKKEASLLFKKLCLKLDALSHFHFTPKPIIEDMSIQANVPALAFEEIAPLAVSDANMLAPEELYAGKGDIKEEAELTQVDRKRRRAHKKRKFKAETAKRMEKKAPDSKTTNHPSGRQR